MKIATIIFPLNDNAGASLSPLLSVLEGEIVETFGGFTSAPVSGAWRDEATGAVYRDESTRYEIAADWNPEQREALESIAARYGFEAGQLAVYVQHANGFVTFVDPGAYLAERVEAVESTSRRTGEPSHKGARRKQAEAFGALFARVA